MKTVISCMNVITMFAETYTSKRRTPLYLLLLVSLLPPMAQAQTGANDAATIAARIERVETGLLGPVAITGQAPKRMALSERMRALKVPGVSIAIINDGKIEWARAYGVADAGDKRLVSTDTLFQVASISKSVSAAAILRLVQQGKLGLDDDVNSCLLSWKLQGAPGAPAPVVTVRQLLSHTGGTTVSGFAGYSPTEPVPGLQAILNGEKPANSPRIFVDTPPGQALRYSGGGYTVLQQMVMDVTGQPFDKLMQANVFDPLNMRHSTFAQPLPPHLQANAASAHDKSGAVLPGKWNTYPTLAAAGLWSTPSDLARFVLAIEHASDGKSGTFLSKPMASAMLTPVLNQYGLGMSLDGRGADARFFHSGVNAGIRSTMVGYVYKGQGAVILTNSDNGGDLIQELLRGIAAEYKWNDYKPVERVLAPAEPALFARYTGKFAVAGRTITVTTRDDTLFVQEDSFGTQPIALLPESATRYFALEANLTLTFLPQSDGAVDAVDVAYFGNYRATRIK